MGSIERTSRSGIDADDNPPNPVARPVADDEPAASPRVVTRAVLDAENAFIQSWGRMGSVWGISRTMAEVHALLYVSGEPLCTDDVMDRLQISRGNASMSLRSLVDWGVVGRAHKRGDRKEYFLAEQNVWSIMRAIVRERLKREVDPMLVTLHEIRDVAKRTREASTMPGAHAPAAQAATVALGVPVAAAGDGSGAELALIASRVEAMLRFFELIDRLGQQFAGPSGAGLEAAAAALLADLDLDSPST